MPDDAPKPMISFPSERTTNIGTVASFTMNVIRDYRLWGIKSPPWFRGEPGSAELPLLPKLYRPRDGGSLHDENLIIQDFRRMAPAVGYGSTPPRSETDQWLFLMQHAGAPTRLLDWTEGALIGLYFALQFEQPVVWMLNPIGLNRLTAPNYPDTNMYPLTWHRPKVGINIGFENIRAAWESDKGGTQVPIAIKPTYVHPRMNAQKSCFTIQGADKRPLYEIIAPELLRKYQIRSGAITKMVRELKVMGVTRSSMFPELDGVAVELDERD